MPCMPCHAVPCPALPRHFFTIVPNWPCSCQVRDLDMAIDVVGMPICREADGLAMSRCGS